MTPRAGLEHTVGFLDRGQLGGKLSIQPTGRGAGQSECSEMSTGLIHSSEEKQVLIGSAGSQDFSFPAEFESVCELIYPWCDSWLSTQDFPPNGNIHFRRIVSGQPANKLCLLSVHRNGRSAAEERGATRTAATSLAHEAHRHVLTGVSCREVRG